MQRPACVPGALRLAVPPPACARPRRAPNAAAAANCTPAQPARSPAPRRTALALRTRHARAVRLRAAPPSGVAAPLSPGGAAVAPAAEADAGGTASAAAAAVGLVESAETRVCGAAADVAGALALLLREVDAVAAAPPPFASGLLRLEVALPRGTDALAWLRSLPAQARPCAPYCVVSWFREPGLY